MSELVLYECYVHVVWSFDLLDNMVFDGGHIV